MPSTTQLLGEVKVTINGTVLTRVSDLILTQPFDGHHTFEITFLPEMLPGKSSKVDLKKLAEDWVGEDINLYLKQVEKTKTSSIERQKLIFDGFVTSVKLVKGSGTANTLLVSGISPTALLSAGKTTRSFTEKSLKSILGAVLSPLAKISKVIDPTFTTAIPYVTQYEEDNFHFMQRLAEDYGEWMFYDGKQLVFGKKGRQKGEEISLKNGVNLFDMQYSVRVTPLNQTGLYYDYYTHKAYQAPSSAEKISGLGSFAKIGAEKSDKVFGDELIELGYQNHHESGPLKRAVQLKKSEQTNKLAVLTGRTPEMEIKLGATVKITDTFLTAANQTESVDYGSFVVTRLSHYMDSRGIYQCNFEALPHDTDFAPVDYRIIQPNAEPQTAKVMKVNDDKSMGRVMVQFPWQEAEGEMTPWARVVHPMASQDKGVYFIPEVGETVFVDFEFGNPDIPFVSGSMYRAEGLPGNLFHPQNNIKGIITRGGNHIMIDDTGGAEKIHIYNRDKQNELELTLGGTMGIKVKSKGQISLEAAEKIILKAPDIQIEAAQKLSVKSATATHQADQQMQLSAGTCLDLDGGAKATLKAAQVMIN